MKKNLIYCFFGFSETIFASNTSSLSLTEISKGVKRSDKFGGLHFFNPVPIMKLLEVVRTPSVSEQTFQALLNYGKKLGKTTVVCKVIATLQLFKNEYKGCS